MISNKIKTIFCFALISTILFPIGILLIVFCGALPLGKGLSLALGIIFVVLGFYGAPILWINFGDLKTKQNLCRQIVDDGIQDIEALSKLYNIDTNTMKNKISEVINKRYLTGYEIVGKFVVPVKQKKLTKQDALTISGKSERKICPGCGAPVEVIEGEKTVCKYCGATVTK